VNSDLVTCYLPTLHHNQEDCVAALFFLEIRDRHCQSARCGGGIAFSGIANQQIDRQADEQTDRDVVTDIEKDIETYRQTYYMQTDRDRGKDRERHIYRNSYGK